MSTTDPDVRSRAAKEVLRPAATAASVIGVLIGPVAALVLFLSPDADALFVVVYLVWIGITVGFGLFAQFVLHHIAGLSIFAYSIAGTGSMFLLFTAGLGREAISADGETGSDVFVQSLIPSVALYVVAAVLYGLHRVHAAAQNATMNDGVNTTATVTRAAIMGHINAAPLWHLTLSFTDQQGIKRWFRTHLLGISFSPGDSIPIRYDPAHPGDKGRIVVAPGAEGDMIQ